MTTLHDMEKALDECAVNGERAVIATVIATEGSVYRRPGARALILQDGRAVGLVSGGCVEGDLFEHAQDVWQAGVGKVMTYDFRGEDDQLWGMGLGCNGAVTVWLQPFDPTLHPEPARAIKNEFARRNHATEAYWLATVLMSSEPSKMPIGHQLTWRDWGEVDFQLPREVGTASVVAGQTDGIQLQLFVEQVVPRPRLFIFGAGEDARVLAQSARFIDWHVCVVDHRVTFLNAARWPGVEEIRLVDRDRYGEVALDERSYAVVMTHNFELDLQIIRALLPSEACYLGILGPRPRWQRLLAHAERELVIRDHDLGKVHAPIGLDLGAETPEEIAVSIVAELLAHHNRRYASPLRNGHGNIHAVRAVQQ